MKDETVIAVVAYMNLKGWTRISFERLTSNVPACKSYQQLAEMVANNPTIFRTAQISGGLEGLALLETNQEELQVSEISDAPPAPAPVALTPMENLQQLIRRAADADVSGSSLNYAQAAVAVATAMQLANIS